MKQFFKHALFALSLSLALLVCTACSPALTIQADSKNGVTLSFQAGFSPAAAETLRSLVAAVNGAVDDALPVVPASDISTVLASAGFTDVQATNPSATDIRADASYKNLAEGALPTTGLLTRTKNTLTLTLGPRQLAMLYMLSNEEAQMYFDLLMIPALDGSDQETSVDEYTNLLASLYGKQFAKDLTGGTLHITLIAPDGKKKTEAKLSLGQALTNTTEQSWTVSW